MSHILTFFEVTEVRELLSLKIASLTKSKLFLIVEKDNNNARFLEADIAFSAQEIKDLEKMLLCTAG